MASLVVSRIDTSAAARHLIPLVLNVEPVQGASAVDPLADEVSWVALRLVGADPQAISTEGDLISCVRRFARVLEVGAMPGRTSAFVDLSASRDTAGMASLGIHLALGVWGSRDQTLDETLAYGAEATRLLGRYPAPYRVVPADPAPLFEIEAPFGTRIAQRTVTVTDQDMEAIAVSRFDREVDAWLGVCSALSEREAPTRLRVTMLATELDVGDHLDIRAQLVSAKEIGDRAEAAGDAELAHRSRRLEATLHDLLESYRSPVWVTEVALVSTAPLPEVFVRGVAGAITNEVDVIHVGEHMGMAAPLVAGRRRLVGGYVVEPEGPGLEVALRRGLPLRGGLGPRRLADLVSLTEAGLVFRFPVPAGAPVPTVPCQVARTLPAPVGLPSVGALVGLSSTGSAVRLDDACRASHVHLMGATGTGKSTLMSRLIEDDLAEPQLRQFVCIDPHGDLAVRACTRAAALGREVLVLDPAEPESASLALFEGVDDPANPDPELIERSVARVVEAVSSHLPREWAGPRFRSAARAALTLLAFAGRGRGLGDVARILGDEDFLDSLLEQYRGPDWAGHHLREFHRQRERADVATWAASKFDDFSARSGLRRVLAPVGSGITMAAAIAAGTPVIANLAIGHLSALDARLLGHLLLSATIDAALERTPNQASLCSVYVDEIHAFPAGNLQRGLSEGRKFGLGLVLAHQGLSQLQPETRDAVLGNAAVRFAFRLAPADADAMAWEYGIPPRDLAAQPNLHAFVRYAPGGRALASFSVLVDPPEPLPMVLPQGVQSIGTVASTQAGPVGTGDQGGVTRLRQDRTQSSPGPRGQPRGREVSPTINGD